MLIVVFFNLRFACHEDASYAMHRLHQLLVCDKRLIVEFANFSILPNPANETSGNPPRYPPACEFTIENISSFLFKNPEFYNKVIQRVNSMKSAASFSVNDDCPPGEASEIEEVEMEELYKEDSEESELESEDDSIAKFQKEVIPEIKGLKAKKLTRGRKLNELRMFPTSSKQPKPTQEIGQVFEKTDLNVGKKMEVKVSYEIPSTSSDVEKIEGFGTFAPPSVSGNISMGTEHEAEESIEFISKQKLLTNRLKEEGNIQIVKIYYFDPFVISISL